MAFDISGALSEAGDWLIDIAQQAGSWIAGKAKGALRDVVNSENKVMPNMLPTATAAMAELSFRGSQGNFATTSYPIVLKAEFFRVADPDPARYGYPSNVIRSLGGLDGFVLCKDAHIAIQGTVDEQLAIESFLNNGVFLDWSRVPIPD